MDKITLYHGSPNKVVAPKYGFGQDKGNVIYKGIGEAQ